ncbi:Mediator of RNA polymerase II transcription subunit 21 [Sarcoptes scabiei]|uniref:Mediator of RNA polymerase II transcription subunit 21 n=1 Tax=Sarcoptes scabiei TaxID=52283 RepID=A0A132AHB3_SARSC|nr:Mediator of RNA polymerase II transcription subunit 21 [Sarcoptes scabiei]KPM10317.1 mediator of RNA polymerase II transcription subunit 21-like protein [Sarcoptes scabiei]
MADRLTQLQDAVNVQAENLCNSIGFLQQCARPTPFTEFCSFSRTSSVAYQQVLSQAGIPIDLGEENNQNEIEENGKDKLIIENGSGGINSTNNVQANRVNGVNNNGTTNDYDNTIQPVQEQADNSKFFAKLITKTAKDIDLIIDSLPSRDMEPELQEAHIRRLEDENREEARKLEEIIAKAEQIRDVIKNALEDIADNLMKMKQLEGQMLTSSSITSPPSAFVDPIPPSSQSSQHT